MRALKDAIGLVLIVAVLTSVRITVPAPAPPTPPASSTDSAETRGFPASAEPVAAAEAARRRARG